MIQYLDPPIKSHAYVSPDTFEGCLCVLVKDFGGNVAMANVKIDTMQENPALAMSSLFMELATHFAKIHNGLAVR